MNKFVIPFLFVFFFLQLLNAIPQKEISSLSSSSSSSSSSNAYLIQPKLNKNFGEQNNIHLNAVSKERETPFIGKCAFVMIIGFALMTLTIYFVKQWSYYSRKTEESDIETHSHYHVPAVDSEKLCDKIYSHILSTKPENLVVLIPVIVLVLFFLAFRAHSQNILEDDPNYSVLQNGVVLLTGGVFLQILDSLTITLYSEGLGNISQALGNLLIIFGFGFLLWGLFEIRSSYQEITTEVKCFISLSFLVVISTIVMKFLFYYGKYQESKENTKEKTVEEINPQASLASKLLSGQRSEEIGNAISFASLLMICLFYEIFHHLNNPPISQTQAYAMIFCTAGIFCQVGLSIIKIFEIEFITTISYSLKTLILITIYSSFFVLIYCIVDNGLENNNSVIFGFILLFVIATLNLIVTFGQEASTFILSQEKDEQQQQQQIQNNFSSLENISKVLKDMSTTIEFAKILCIVFMYLHFRAEIFLQQDPKSFISGFSYLSVLIELATAAILIQMLAQIGEFFAGLNGYLSFTIGICFLVSFVALCGSVAAATSKY